MKTRCLDAAGAVLDAARTPGQVILWLSVVCGLSAIALPVAEDLFFAFCWSCMIVGFAPLVVVWILILMDRFGDRLSFLLLGLSLRHWYDASVWTVRALKHPVGSPRNRRSMWMARQCILAGTRAEVWSRVFRGESWRDAKANTENDNERARKEDEDTVLRKKAERGK